MHPPGNPLVDSYTLGYQSRPSLHVVRTDVSSTAMPVHDSTLLSDFLSFCRRSPGKVRSLGGNGFTITHEWLFSMVLSFAGRSCCVVLSGNGSDDRIQSQ